MIFVTNTTPLYHIGFIWSGDKKECNKMLQKWNNEAATNEVVAV